MAQKWQIRLKTVVIHVVEKRYFDEKIMFHEAITGRRSVNHVNRT